MSRPRKLGLLSVSFVLPFQGEWSENPASLIADPRDIAPPRIGIHFVGCDPQFGTDVHRGIDSEPKYGTH